MFRVLVEPVPAVDVSEHHSGRDPRPGLPGLLHLLEHRAAGPDRRTHRTLLAPHTHQQVSQTSVHRDSPSLLADTPP